MEFKIPFVDEEIDVTDPGSAAMTALTVGGGFVVFYVLSDVGRRGANKALDVTGMNDGDGIEVL